MFALTSNRDSARMAPVTANAGGPPPRKVFKNIAERVGTGDVWPLCPRKTLRRIPDMTWFFRGRSGEKLAVPVRSHISSQVLNRLYPPRVPGRLRSVRYHVGVAALLGVLLLSSVAFAQRVTTEVSQRTITVSDQVDLEIQIQGRYDERIDPDLSDWTVVSESTSSQVQIINGQYSQTKVFRRVLEPRRAGKLKIGPVQLLVGGQVVATAPPIEVEVRQEEQLPVLPSGSVANLSAYKGQQLFIFPSISQNTVYEGEPVLLMFDLYAAASLRVSDGGGSKVPNLDNFLVSDVTPDGRKGQVRKQVDGVLYNVFPLRWSVVVPLEAKTTTIGSMEMKVQAGTIFDARRVTVRSNPFSLEILPIPTDGRPASYREGNVGEFTIQATLSVSGNAAKVGERVFLNLQISGKGNLEGIKAPDPDPIDGVTIERLAGSETSNIRRDTSGISGDVTFSYILTPQRAGTVKIPGIGFSYFNPKTKKFATVKTTHLEFNVAESETAAAASSSAPGGGVKPITATISTASNSADRSKTTPVFWLALCLPLMLYLSTEFSLRLRKHRTNNAPQIRSKRALSNARRVLKQSLEYQREGKEQDFYNQITRALLGYLEDRFSVAAAGMTHDAIRRFFSEKGCDSELAELLISELENCDFARFAPAAVRKEEMQRSLDRSLALLEALDRWAATLGVQRAA